MLLLERRVLCVAPLPRSHHTTHIPNSIHEELHYVQHCWPISGLILTILGVLSLHARQQHHGPFSLKTGP
jgi:hypothetical protein